MLTVRFKDGGYLGIHVGSRIPSHFPDLTEVVSVAADGHELEKVEMEFQNIPNVSGRRVKTWVGETAQFIYANWRG